jgi:N6-L-threonylcarbamoyladenine synthase
LPKWLETITGLFFDVKYTTHITPSQNQQSLLPYCHYFFMIILAIESSCDDTSAALLDVQADSVRVIAEQTASQIDLHAMYGGVIPELAGRAHAEAIYPVIQSVEQGNPPAEAIAVTSGPGLVTGLLVGIEAAKTLAYLRDLPLISVNHMEGHLYSTLLPQTLNKTSTKQWQFPALALVVSGGHTEIVLIKEHGVYEKLGQTRDDAAGECFDKIAKMLGLAYPGGPKISQYAQEGNPAAIDFPRPMITSPDLDMSFSGLKTSVRYFLRDHDLSEKDTPSLADVCASAERAIIDVLLSKMKRAIKKHQPKTILLAGGVSANELLRTELSVLAGEIPVLLPPRQYCMDNAAMIGLAGGKQALKNAYTPWQEISANPIWRIDNIT